jgi:hypothetical protein
MLQALLDAAVRSIGLATVVWLGLNLLRLRNPHIQLAAWTVVLGASLLMPAATRLAAVVIPPAPVVAPAVDDILPFLSEISSPQRADVTIPVVADTPAAARRDTAAAAPRTLSAEARASDPGGAWCASLIYTALAATTSRDRRLLGRSFFCPKITRIGRRGSDQPFSLMRRRMPDGATFTFTSPRC